MAAAAAATMAALSLGEGYVVEPTLNYRTVAGVSGPLVVLDKVRVQLVCFLTCRVKYVVGTLPQQDKTGSEPKFYDMLQFIHVVVPNFFLGGVYSLCIVTCQLKLWSFAVRAVSEGTSQMNARK